MTLARPVAGRVFDIEFAAWRGALGVDRAPHRLADFTGQCDAARLAGVGAAKPNNAADTGRVMATGTPRPQAKAPPASSAG